MPDKLPRTSNLVVPAKPIRRKSLIKNHFREIRRDHFKCTHLLKVRFRTIFVLMAMFSLIQVNRQVGPLCVYYRNLTNSDPLKKTDWRIVRFLRMVLYVMANIIAGWLSDLYGAKWILFSSLTGSALCLFVLPLALLNRIGMYVLFSVEGLFYGLAQPACHAMLARWAIPSERILMNSIVYAGFSLGKAVAVMLSICVCSVFGWEYAVYTTFGISILMMLVWMILIEDHYEGAGDRITKEEKDFMARELADQLYHYKDQKYSRLPLKEILTCEPLWAVLVVHWTYIFSQMKFSTSIRYNLDKMQVGVESRHNMGTLNHAVIIAQPYFWSAVMTWILGLTFFNLESGHILTKIGAYRMGAVIGILGILITIIIKLILEGRTIDLFYDQIAMATLAGFLSTVDANYLDMAPNYAGTLMGIHSLIITIPQVVIFDMFGHVPMVQNLQGAILLTLIMLSLFFYQFFVTGNLMTWNDYPLSKGPITQMSHHPLSY